MIWAYVMGSVVFVSLLSLLGIVVVNNSKIKSFLHLVVGFSAGAFFGDVFFHLLPEATEHGFTIEMSVAVLSGILFSFIIEKYVHWHHCHNPSHDHHHPFAIMSLVGDGVHNFVDGLIIGAAYLASIPVGIATTLAVVMHEIPQELADYALLVHGGFSRYKALLMNFLTAATAIVGAGIALILQSSDIVHLVIPFAAGSFIYIAAADLIPEIHKETRLTQSLIQLGMFILGMAVMGTLLFVEVAH